MPSKGDAEFGQAAVERGYLSDKIAQIYLKKMKQFERRGQKTSIDSLLIVDRMLSLEQVFEIQKEMGRRIQFCPSCGSRHNVITFEPGEKVRCTKCAQRFEIEDWSQGVPPRPVVVHTPASSAELVRVTDEPPDQDDAFVFECPECGASLTLEDEFCGRCNGVGERGLQERP